MAWPNKAQRAAKKKKLAGVTEKAQEIGKKYKPGRAGLEEALAQMAGKPPEPDKQERAGAVLSDLMRFCRKLGWQGGPVANVKTWIQGLQNGLEVLREHDGKVMAVLHEYGYKAGKLGIIEFLKSELGNLGRLRQLAKNYGYRGKSIETFLSSEMAALKVLKERDAKVKQAARLAGWPGDTLEELVEWLGSENWKTRQEGIFNVVDSIMANACKVGWDGHSYIHFGEWVSTKLDMLGRIEEAATKAGWLGKSGMSVDAYIERELGQNTKLISVGNKHGWNGVSNSKILWQFFDDELTKAEQAKPQVKDLKDPLIVPAGNEYLRDFRLLCVQYSPRVNIMEARTLLAELYQKALAVELNHAGLNLERFDGRAWVMASLGYQVSGKLPWVAVDLLNILRERWGKADAEKMPLFSGSHSGQEQGPAVMPMLGTTYTWKDGAATIQEGGGDHARID